MDEERGEPVLSVWYHPEHAVFHLRYARDGAEFAVRRDAGEVWAWGAVHESDRATYLLGPVMGLVCHLRGIPCLHASAVAVDGRALLVVGAPGAGKSTTAAALAALGHPLVADDVVALRAGDGGIEALPAYPWLRLWPSSAEMLYGSRDALPPIVPGHAWWDKRFLDLSEREDAFAAEPLPVGAVYLLEPRSDAVDGAEVTDAEPVEALLTLVAHTYAQYLTDAAMQAAELPVLARLTREVPVRRVVPSADASDLPRLRDAILGDFAARRAAA
ncbi:MAG TPA: hypothetical protein VF771_21985 [Longimicrobiaceae bacterium]